MTNYELDLAPGNNETVSDIFSVKSQGIMKLW